MPNSYFEFQQFRIEQEKTGMKVTTDACLFGAWVANQVVVSGQVPTRILDIGTGTGLLALMLAQAAETSDIDAIEINEDAFNEASDNILGSPWKDRIKPIHSSVQHFTYNNSYDIIISNPPFFKASPKGTNSDKNQALHELTLSQEDLLFYASQLLSADGSFYVMYPEREMDAFVHKAQQVHLRPKKVISVRNKASDGVFRKMIQFSFNIEETQASEIVIRENGPHYTTEFWELLKHYYLDYNAPSTISQ